MWKRIQVEKFLLSFALSFGNLVARGRGGKAFSKSSRRGSGRLRTLAATREERGGKSRRRREKAVRIARGKRATTPWRLEAGVGSINRCTRGNSGRNFPRRAPVVFHATTEFNLGFRGVEFSLLTDLWTSKGTSIHSKKRPEGIRLYRLRRSEKCVCVCNKKRVIIIQ